jgi:hypothetical protein
MIFGVTEFILLSVLVILLFLGVWVSRELKRH